jgi:aminopeptidase N
VGTYGVLDVLDYDVQITLPAPGGTVIQGEAGLTFMVARPGVGAATLDFTGLAVVETRLNGAIADASMVDGRLTIPLPKGVGTDDTLSLVVRYRGTPDDGLILRNNVHGRPAAFVDNWPNRTRFWLPSVDHPSDKATASITIHAPEAWDVVATGALLEAPGLAPPAADGVPRRTWRWRTDVEVSPYNLVFGATQMDVVPLGLAACGLAPASPRADGCVEVTAWLFAEDTSQASSSFGRSAEMVDFYSELVGPFAFEKLAHVQSATRFGGMENASAIFYTEQGLASGRDMEGTVAHETAHQWFGGHVTQVDWPELWLSEGFATYFGHLFFEHADGVGVFRARMEESRRSYLESDVTGDAVIDRDETDLFELLNANNYPKGGWILHMLRGLVGDEVFFSGIRRYYEGFSGRNASSDDLRDVMEAVSGQDLAWFFGQWLEHPGYPVLSVGSEWDSAANEVVVTITQVQADAWPAFRFPLLIESVLPGGARERSRVEMVGRTGTFRLPLSEEPEALTVDPDGWLLHRLAGR